MRLDFVSDVACPWCAVGLNALERALERIGSDLPIELHFQPFELNPDMGPEGADAAAYLKAKYGMDDARLAQARATLRERGAGVGFEFGERARVWNTFDAHRLLHEAGLQGGGEQRRLKHALLTAYHREGRNPAAPEVLREAGAAAGLEAGVIEDVLGSDRHAEAVREAEGRWQAAGIRAVPSLVIDGRHLLQGAQPPEVLEDALRRIATGA
ncbi:MAG: DsbA family oxidoreductase [Ideonella sp.]|jgi:predicted DsbA family dithiol-disulfide isomerase|nr:DsbA family oxidoreductase [Ideonella sp.]